MKTYTHTSLNDEQTHPAAMVAYKNSNTKGRSMNAVTDTELPKSIHSSPRQTMQMKMIRDLFSTSFISPQYTTSADVIQPKFKVGKIVYSGKHSEETDNLVEEIKVRDDRPGGKWIKYLRNMANRNIKVTNDTTFDDMDKLIEHLRKIFPPKGNNPNKYKEKKEKLEKKKELIEDIDTSSNTFKYGEFLGEFSDIGFGILEDQFLKTKEFKDEKEKFEESLENEDKKITIDTGNLFKDFTIYNFSEFPEDVPHGGYFGKGYVQFPRKKTKPKKKKKRTFKRQPFKRSRLTVVNTGKKKAYTKESNILTKTSGKQLESLELVSRFPEHIISNLLRKQLHKQNVEKEDILFDPIGNYSLFELPLATDNTIGTQNLFSQNRGNIFEKSKDVDQNKVLGKRKRKKENITLRKYKNEVLDYYNEKDTERKVKKKKKLIEDSYRIVRNKYYPSCPSPKHYTQYH